MENNEKKFGRPSVWDYTLGKVKPGGTEFPPEVWQDLKDTRTKRVLNKMAIDQDYKQKIWNTIPENEADNMPKTEE